MALLHPAAGAPPPMRPRKPLMNALRFPAFAKFLAANTFSYLGNWIERLAMSWIAWESSHSAFWTGIVAVGHIIPAAVLGPVFGALAERWELRRAAIAINIVLACFSTALFLMVIAVHPPVQLLAAASLLIGIASSLNHPVRLVIISQLVPAVALSSAARLNATSYNLSRVLGPALAGVLIAAFGAEWSLAANPLTFVPLILVFYTITLIPRERESDTQEPLLQSILEGMRYVRRDRIIRWCLIIAATSALFTRGVLEIIPVIVGQLLVGDSVLLAAITSACGGGAIVASVITSVIIPSHANAKKVTSLAAMGGALAILLVGLVPTMPSALIALTVASFCATLSAINSQTLVYGFAESAYRARTLTWWSTFSLGASAGGGVVMSLLAEFVALENLLIGAGALAFCSGAALYARRPATPQAGCSNRSAP